MLRSYYGRSYYSSGTTPLRPEDGEYVDLPTIPPPPSLPRENRETVRPKKEGR